ncbi:MAG: hypothetical protein HYU69_00365 [Bacteroidetes bacterium]|nr:hypothetical protein [Bacteroidota bacterium]
MDKNIYIQALEIGTKNMTNGISYNELLEKLNAFGLKPHGEFQKYFHLWFYKKFYYPALFRYINLPSNGGAVEENELEGHDNQFAILTAEGYTEYLDFLKLEQAKIDTQRAHELSMTAIKWSRIAVYISAGMALIQILLQLFQSNNSCH